MTVVLYRSTDTSAPALSGTAGSLVALLDACLVNGYGSKSAAGWTKSFSATNKAVYRMGGGNQFYLDVDDSAAQTAAAKEANVRGYEVMTAVATGTNPFPTTAQIASPGLNFRKSASADATARAWIIAADNRTFHLWVQNGDTANRWEGMYFGDFYSLVSGDSYRTCLVARPLTSANSTTYSNVADDTTSAALGGHYLARPTTAVAGAQQFGKTAFGVNGSGTLYTNEAGLCLDGNYYITSFQMGSTAEGRLRGRLRGIWKMWGIPNEGDTFSGASGDLSGRSFLVLGAAGAGVNSLAVETSDTWDTSS